MAEFVEMTYRQDTVERSCEICGEPIQPDEWMIDLFRKEGRVEWVHENCCRKAVEHWLKKKREKESKATVQ